MSRVFSLFLMPCLLLTQSIAALGHSHGGDQPAGHDLRPHFHVAHFLTTETGGHHHHGAHGHHDDHGDRGTASDPESAPQPEPLSDDEHDSDAVYVAQVDCFLCRATDVDESLSVGSEWVSHESRLAVTVCDGALHGVTRWRQTLRCGSTCARYIELRTLRI